MLHLLADWISNFVPSNDAKGVVLGLSGGVDSAVVGAVSKEALGAERAILYALPCDSNPEDLEDARMVADHLEMPLEIIDLSSRFAAYIDGVEFTKEKEKMIHANIKARLRMTMLYAKAFEYDCLVAGTGNKSELAIGYLTKYGDGGVDFEPIGDYYKTEVWEMAEAIGLPSKIIEKKPSAGLWLGQTDEEELGMTYFELDKILQNPKPDPSDPKVQRVMELISRSAHKRKMPPMFSRGNYV